MSEDRGTDTDVDTDVVTDTVAETGKLPLWAALQLGLLFFGQGVLSVLLLSVMNRVMIDENLLGISATVATGCLSIRFFVAVVRVYLGQLTDTRPFWGSQRTGYIRVALPIAGLLLFLALQVVWRLGEAEALEWIILLSVILGVYGVFLFMVAVSGMALVYDIAPADDRSRVMGVVWSMMLMGLVGGGQAGAKLLKTATGDEMRAVVDQFFALAIVVAVVLGWLGTWGIERRFSRSRERIAMEENTGRAKTQHVGFIAALGIFMADRQSTRFFVFLFFVTLGVFMQRPVLEPFGGEVFGMTIAETTALTPIWGGATLLALIITGFTLSPRLGPWRTTRIGLIVCALGFAGIVAAGAVATTGGSSGVLYLQLSVALMGAGGGIAVNAMLGLMLGLSPAANAGLYLGTFGLAQYLSQGISLVVSGVLVDAGRHLFEQPATAYGVVFGLEVAILLGCVALLYYIERTTPDSAQTG